MQTLTPALTVFEARQWQQGHHLCMQNEVLAVSRVGTSVFMKSSWAIDILFSLMQTTSEVGWSEARLLWCLGHYWEHPFKRYASLPTRLQWKIKSDSFLKYILQTCSSPCSLTLHVQLTWVIQFFGSIIIILWWFFFFFPLVSAHGTNYFTDKPFPLKNVSLFSCLWTMFGRQVLGSVLYRYGLTGCLHTVCCAVAIVPP